MKLIGENIHIISKKTREAIESRNKGLIQEMALKQKDMEWIDLNIGPARKGWEGTMDWLTNTILEVLPSSKLSFDSSNIREIESGLKLVKNPTECIVNSASADPERLENMVRVASEYGTYLIALTLSDETGIPREADGRMEMACVITEKTAESGIDNTKILMDPLVLPVSVDQSQAMEALNAIRMFKESFDPAILTTIGLSNISNGSPKELRPLINRVFAVMAAGSGLDTAIADALDIELIRVNRVIETQTIEKDSDKLYLNIFNLMQEFGEFEDLTYNKENPEEIAIYKTAEILMNKNIYAHNYLG
ncbi:MAG: dihydropteroate synthase [bacterium]